MSATTIITKHGSGAPAVGDLVQGELAVDLTNQTLYSKDSSGNVFKVGDTGGGSPGTFTDLVATDSFTSPGIDDNATATAITIDGSLQNQVTINSPQAGTTKVVGPLYASTSGYNFNLECRDDSAFNTSGNGGGIGFGYQVSSTDYEVGPIIQGYKDNNTSGDYAGGLHFSTRASNQNPRVRMTITSDGDVGIGATNPSTKLDVDGTVTCDAIEVNGGSSRYIFMTSSDGTGECEIRLGDTADTDAGSLAYDNASDSMQFRAGAAERMLIDSEGNVGIGTSDPAKKRHVLGSFDTAGFYRDIDVDVVGPAGNWAEFGAKKAGVEIGAASFGCQLQADGLRGSAVIQTLTNGTLTRKLTVDSVGSVGIGTANPLGKLDVRTDGSGEAHLFLSNGLASAEITSTATDYTFGTGTQTPLAFKTNNIERMRIDASGNVGIGEDEPNARLAIKTPGTSEYAIRVGNQGGASSSVKGATFIGLDVSAPTATYPSAFVGVEQDGTAGFKAALTLGTRRTNSADVAPTEAMRIDSAGDATFTGTARASEIRVRRSVDNAFSGRFGPSSTDELAVVIENTGGVKSSLTLTSSNSAEFSGTVSASNITSRGQIIQDGAPVVDSLQIIRAFMKLRDAVDDPDSSVEELRNKLKVAVVDIIDQFQDQIDNMDDIETPVVMPSPETPEAGTMDLPE